MLKGEKVVLRAYSRDDAARQAEFYKDVELWALRQQSPGRYVVGSCELTNVHPINRTCNLGIQIGDRD
jgi:RimJ/RimL family protein N-acetyltransferase